MNDNQPHEDPDCSSDKRLSKEAFPGEDQKLIERWYQKLAEEGLPDPSETDQKKGDLERLGNDMANFIEERIAADTSSPRPLWRRRWLTVAAAALLTISGVAAVFTWKSFSKPVLVTLDNNSGQIREYDLPDGTHIWLNKNSRGAYRAAFSKNERRFLLHEGEFFFEVESDSLKPFFVEAPGFTIRVLGTSFNVKTLKDLPSARVTVASGQVHVISGDNESGILEKDDQLIIDRHNGTFATRRISSEESDAWRHGQIYLDDVPFSELAKALEILFDVQVDFPEDKLGHQHASIHFATDDQLPDILQIICDIYGISYSFNKNQVIFK